MVVRHYGLQWTIRDDCALVVLPVNGPHQTLKTSLGWAMSCGYTTTFKVGKKDPNSKAVKITAEYNGEQTTYALNHEKYCIWQHSHKDVAEWYRYAIAELMGGKLTAYKTWARVSVSFGPLIF